MNALDKVEMLQKKKHLTKKDKCEFLATLPEVVFSITGFQPIESLPSPEAVAKFYTDDDIQELFDYWYGYFKGLKDKRDTIWKEN